MTNKLPVVGKRYKSKGSGSLYKLQEISGSLIILRSKEDKKYSNLEDFWLNFEELPEDKGKTKRKNQNLEVSLEVKEAMKELNDVCNEKVVDGFKIRNYAENLLNALDKQFNKKSESVVEDDCPAEVAADEWNSEIFASNKIEAEESIWKPVSELPKKPALPFQCFIKDLSSKVHLGVMCNGILQLEGDNSIWPANNHAFLSISDFINHYEKLEERVKKLEEKLNDK